MCKRTFGLIDRWIDARDSTERAANLNDSLDVGCGSIDEASASIVAPAPSASAAFPLNETTDCTRAHGDLAG
jgi:hypothetical protein